jgi:hypothetical protein
MPAQMRMYVLSTPNDQTSSAMPQRPAGILKKVEKKEFKEKAVQSINLPSQMSAPSALLMPRHACQELTRIHPRTEAPVRPR